MAFNVKFYQGTQEAYDALVEKEPKSFYYIDNKNLYLGNFKLTNDEDIQNVLTTLASHAITFEDLYQQIEGIKAEQGEVNAEAIENLEKQIEQINTNITNNNQQFDQYKAEMELTYSSLDTSMAEINITISEMQASILTNAVDLEEKTNEIKTTLGEHLKTMETLQEQQIQHSLLLDDTTAKTNIALEDIGTCSARIDTLVGEDEGMSAREIAAFEVAKIVADADEKYDSLKEIADWILNDTVGVTDIKAKINICEQDIESLRTNLLNLELRMEEAENAILEINNDKTGILVQSKMYADQAAQQAQTNAEAAATEELNTYKSSNDIALFQMNSAIEALQRAMVEGGGGGGGGASAEIIQGMIDTSILNLNLGTAASANVEDFDAAGSANNALVQAKAYSDSNKQDALTYVDTALTWGHIPVIS